MPSRTVVVTEGITLGQFLKYSGAVSTGGHAKALIEEGDVRVNEDVVRQRGRKLRAGDVVSVLEQEFVVARSDSGGPATPQ